MKRKLLVAIMCMLSFIAIGAVKAQDKDDNNKNAKKEEQVITVPLSAEKWESIKDAVDHQGYCVLEEQNVLLVITNGCPALEYFLPIDLRINDNTLKVPEFDEREDQFLYHEPFSYFYQSF